MTVEHAASPNSVWLVLWLRDSGETVIHASNTREDAVAWAIRNFNELFDPEDGKNRAIVFRLPVNEDWNGSHEGARTIAIRECKLSVGDFDSGKVIDSQDTIS